MVVSLASNERGTGFICGHDDGSIIRFYISEESGTQVSGRIIQHQTTPIALAWANGYIIAAGCDRRILFYDSQVCVNQNVNILFVNSSSNINYEVNQIILKREKNETKHLLAKKTIYMHNRPLTHQFC